MQNVLVEDYEVAIIGSGPAGLAAAINLKVRNKKFVLLGYPSLSYQVEVSALIDNLLGFPNITGKDLNRQWQKHLDDMQIEVTDERVHQVYANVSDGQHIVSCREHDYKVKSVIVAAGLIRNHLLIGEQEMLGRGGVSYCATCDAMFYKGKKVIVLASTKDAVHEVEYLCEVVQEVVFIPNAKVEGEVKAANCTYVKGKAVEILHDGMHFSGLKMQDGSVIEADGLFILKDAVGAAYLVPGIESDEESIFVDADMRTNLKGIFAAGDCTGKPWQLMRAMGQGQVAALNSVRYLDEKDYWN